MDHCVVEKFEELGLIARKRYGHKSCNDNTKGKCSVSNMALYMRNVDNGWCLIFASFVRHVASADTSHTVKNTL